MSPVFLVFFIALMFKVPTIPIVTRPTVIRINRKNSLLFNLKASMNCILHPLVDIDYKAYFIPDNSSILYSATNVYILCKY